MRIYKMGMPETSFGAYVFTAPDGAWRFAREEKKEGGARESDIGTVMTGDEMMQWLDREIEANQNRKKTMEDLIKGSCPGWSTAKFKFVGEAETYSYYEFVEEMERRSAPGKEENACVPGLGGSHAVPESGETGRPVSEEQIALLFADSQAVDKEMEETEDAAGKYWERSFGEIAPNAPEAVKNAWLEAAEAVGVDGMGVSRNGKLTHISQMMVQRCVRWQRGENVTDMLGNSVQSARQAVQRALEDLAKPLPGHVRSPEKRQNQEREKKFCLEFLKRLERYE